MNKDFYYILIFKMKGKAWIKNIFSVKNRNKFIIVITTITAISLVISLFVDFYKNCEHQKLQVDYSNKYSDCRCKTFMTDTTILNYVTINGYSSSSYINVPNGNANIYSLEIIPNQNIYYLDNMPLYTNVYPLDVQLIVPLNNWYNQLQTMDILPFTLKPIYLYIEWAFNVTIDVKSKLAPGLCGNLPIDTSISNGVIISGETYVSHQFDNYCLYITHFNETIPTGFLEISNYLYQSIIDDFDNDLFSSKNVKYCIPDYCLIPSCNNGIYQIILLSVSISATCYTVIKFLTFCISKYLHKSKDVELT